MVQQKNGCRMPLKRSTRLGHQNSDNVVFSDGSSLTVKDVAFTFNKDLEAGGKIDLSPLESAERVVLLITHDIKAVLSIADRVQVFCGGVSVEEVIVSRWRIKQINFHSAPPFAADRPGRLARADSRNPNRVR